MVILIREESYLLTSDLQFSFQTGSTTTMCTAMVQETVSCYVYNGINVLMFMVYYWMQPRHG